MKEFVRKLIHKTVNVFTLLKFSASSGALKRQLESLYFENALERDFSTVRNFYLGRILSHAIDKVPFYNNVSNPVLCDFPVVSKAIYQSENESCFQSISMCLTGKYKMNTGGSTGEPFYFYAGLRAGLVDSMHQVYQHRKMGLKPEHKLYTFNGFMPSNEQIKKNKFWRAKKNKLQMPFGSKEFSTHFLNESYFSFYLEEFFKSPPDYIRSYPSAICDFTLLLIKSGYKVKPFDLRGIQLTSEAMSEQQEHIINEYWGDIVYHQYGHSEVAVIAAKYPGDDCYSFSPIYGEVEILDDNNIHVAPNCEGRIVVTSFHNFARPFIRYDTGDLAIYKDSENGIVKAFKITGRSQDYVVNKFNENISVTGLVFGQHFKAFAKILQWQIVNTIPGDLLVKIIKNRDFDKEDEKEVIEKLSFHGQFSVAIEYVTTIEKTARGKHKLVIREFDL
ncbi:hypothetical protein K5M76_14740 [Shewanella xiamenensis]|uniref:hypothetical protein n=1 Tax=Shewanella TaxID=22 RepID=UPI000D65D150|nr:hypothetical protein [Shewanella xiamenensis]MCT8858004.1 hypothetical protein [Shewanella xiamenensis]PWH04403.1 hypothetical protein DIY08_03360 [Shewanella xiamenensis]UWG63474.1 hypothetical protein K5M76_14740 [Shewanella xiamenensis]